MKFVAILALLGLSLTSEKSFATITIYSISGASHSSVAAPVTTTTTPTVPTVTGTNQLYGGSSNIAATGRCPGDGGTCNTCAGDAADGIGPVPCNVQAVLPSTGISISFKSDSTTGYIAISANNIVLTSIPIQTYISGQTTSYNLTWQELCQAIDAAAVGNGTDSCVNLLANTASGVLSATLNFGVSTTSQGALTDQAAINFKISSMLPASDNVASAGVGVEDFELFPGDGKAYINTMSPTTLSAGGSFTAAAVDAFYIQGTAPHLACAEMPNVTSDTNLGYSRIALDTTTFQPTDSQITGLTNDTSYAVVFGIEDDCGNIGFFTTITTIGAAAPIPANNCVEDQHTVTPEPVFGLLDKSASCFISTAAYGSPLNDKVMTFRHFRDHILKHYAWGRSFIEFYYQNSPPYADIIRHNENLRAAVRVVLWPLWLFSVITLKIGLFGFFASLFSLITLGVLLKKKFLRTTTLVIFLSLFLGGHSGHAQANDNFFDLDNQSQTKSVKPKEKPPQEPPYTGTEAEEFKADEKTPAEKPTADSQPVTSENDAHPTDGYDENYVPGPVNDNPAKWKAFHRVPDEQRLKELSDEGLFKITKRGDYLYKVEESPQNAAGSIRVGPVSFPNLKNPASGVTFQNIYGGSQFMLMGDYEWQFFKSAGKMGLKFGSGLLAATGNGRFASRQPRPNGEPSTDVAKEKYNFFMFPNSVSLIYRLDIFKRQWLVPFAEAGGDYFTFVEFRDDGNSFKFGGAPVAHFAVGGSFLLDVIDRQAMVAVDREYGVNHIWLTMEYRHFAGVGNYDFTDNLVDGGVMFEF